MGVGWVADEAAKGKRVVAIGCFLGEYDPTPAPSDGHGAYLAGSTANMVHCTPVYRFETHEELLDEQFIHQLDLATAWRY